MAEKHVHSQPAEGHRLELPERVYTVLLGAPEGRWGDIEPVLIILPPCGKMLKLD